MRLSKSLSLRFAAVALAASVAAMDAASAQNAAREYRIAEQSLGQALREFALASNLDLLFSPDLVSGKKSPSLDGKFTVDEGLRTLLRGSGLEFSVSGSRVVISEPKIEPARQATSSSSGLQRTNGYTRLAQAEPSPSLSSSTAASASTAQPSNDSRIELEEIIVTGTNIRGVYPSSSPVEIYTAEDIARTGATTTVQFIEKLPQNLGTVTPYGSGSNGREGVTGIDLRGLGRGTTLVLINGRRLSRADRGQTVDVSMIPASAIDRVEVLTDGASAIYGSDAIGGVVNFVLRKDFDGAETRLSYGGHAGSGLNQGGVTQTFGGHWQSGHALVSYDYFDASALKRTDRGYSRGAAPGTLTPDTSHHTILVTVSQSLTDRLTVGADLLLGTNDIKSSWRFTGGSTNPLNFQLLSDNTRTDQGLVNLGLDYEVNASLHASVRTSYSRNDSERKNVTTLYNDPSVPPALRLSSNRDSALDTTAMLDGALFALPAGDLRFSVVAGVLDEEYVGTSQNGRVGAELGRRTKYAIAEIFAPLISPGQQIPFAHRLELSLAARYTDTADRSKPTVDRDFGSATDPQVGLLWAPVEQLNLRATYGTSFRAPPLLQIDPVNASSVQFFEGFPVPLFGGQTSTLMVLSGISVDIQSETAETHTFGFDFRPYPGFELSATYYTIDYEDRIALPDFGAAPLISPADFSELLIRQPSAAVIERLLRQSTIDPFTTIDVSDPAAAAALLAADPNFWLYDLRWRNLALSRQKGLDISISNRFTVPWGEVRLGANMTRIFEYEQTLLSGTPPITVLDTADLPVSFRGRMYAGLSHRGIDGTLSLNYADDYTNPGDPSGTVPIDSWTTIDLSLSYDFAAAGHGGFFSGARANLSVQNVFDREPPFVVRGAFDERFGFDPRNANPLGRLISVGIVKSW